MLHSLKKRLFFVVARYFGFWAKVVLIRWKPRIIVVTGSSGKTTALHLIEAQLGTKAVYSHYANSAFGVPFNILGMNPNVGSKVQWLAYLLKAPFYIFRDLPKTKLYIVEADCDRPGEGKLLARLLRPEVTIWVSVYRTHSMNFDNVVGSRFASHEEAISYEFGYFAAATTKLVIANGKQKELVDQLKRVPDGTNVKLVSTDDVKDYEVTLEQTNFVIKGQEFRLNGIHPKELGMTLQLISELVNYLGFELDKSFKNFKNPPGRNSLFKGIKGTILMDSTYNTGLGATKAVLKPFNSYPNDNKWLVIGDILEQGSLEQEEHENLAKLIVDLEVKRLVLLGPRTRRFTLPIIKNKKPGFTAVSFDKPDEALEYLKENLAGGELILFKGGRYLEGVVEQLLENPADAKNLVRRGKAWEKRRRSWGLPK